MEHLVVDGFVKGVLDITTTELADELVRRCSDRRATPAGGGGKNRRAPGRFRWRPRYGQFWRTQKQYRSNFASRLFYPHNPRLRSCRTTPQENKELGEMLARKLNQAKGPVVLLLPLPGRFQHRPNPGQPFFDPVADKSLFDALRSNVGPNVKLLELDRHINDPEFAAAVADEFLKCAEATSGLSVGASAIPGSGS